MAWRNHTAVCTLLQVLIDGVDVRDMDLHWLRGQLGLVSQEPVLFSCTIFDNISYGRAGATVDEVIAAAKAANAHSFIEKLPEGYDTQVRNSELCDFRMGMLSMLHFPCASCRKQASARLWGT